MAKTRERSIGKDMLDLGAEYHDGGIIEKKPNWVNLAQLDGPTDDSLANRLLYKPALRFHGLTGGLWGQGLSDAPSVISESRPPSYRFADPMSSRFQGGEACSTCDVDTVYNPANISARSPLTLRRRNTVAVILVAIALLAAVAAIAGLVLHFLHPRAMLRANVRFTIANRNFTEDMRNSSSIDYNDVTRPLCTEMDVYFLTSELADFYLGCRVVSLRNDESKSKNGTAVHYTLDFIENKVTNDGERIKKIIMRKSGRHKTNDTLYLVVRDFLVYLRSLKVDTEVLPLPDDHPGRKIHPRIPWDDDIDLIARKSSEANESTTNRSVLIDINQLTPNLTTTQARIFDRVSIEIPRIILPGGEIKDLPNITPTRFHHSASMQQHTDAMHLSNVVMQMLLLSNVFKNVLTPVTVNVGSKESIVQGGGAFINPTRASLHVTQIRPTTIRNVGRIPTVQELNLHNDIHVQELSRDNNVHAIASSTSASKTSNENGIYTNNNDIFNQIEASFNDVNENYKTSPTATKTLQGENIQNDKDQLAYSEELNQKIFTIYTDVFLILGTNTNSESLITIQPTSVLQSYTSLNATSNADIPAQALNEFIEKQVNVEKKPVRTKLVDEPPIKFLENKLLNSFTLLTMNSSTITEDVHTAKKSAFIEQSLSVVVPKLVMDVVELLNQNPHEINPDTALLITANRNMQMNEMIVDLPLQEPAFINADNFEWVNLFTVPQRTVNVRVGNINKDGGGNIPINNAGLINRNLNEVNTDSGISAIITDVTVIERPPKVTWQNLHRNHVDQNIMTRAQINTISQSGDEQTVNEPYTGINSDAKRVINNNQIRPKMTDVVHVVRNANKFNRKAFGYYGPFIAHSMNTRNFVSSDLTGTTLYNTSRKKNIGAKQSNLWNGNTLSAVVRDSSNSGRAIYVGRSNKLLRGSSSSKTINSWTAQSTRKSGISNRLPNNLLNARIGKHNGRNKFIVANSNSATNTWESKQPGIAKQPYNQPWTSFNNHGVKATRYDKGIVDNRPIIWTGNITYPGVRQYPDGRMGRIPFANKESNSVNRSKQLKTNWSNTHLARPFANLRQSAWRQSRSMMMNRDLSYQGLQMNMNWGLPKSRDFSDIEDMKDILRQLVENMYNMTEKIDQMQNAIDFINRTFHETHQPLFNLEETLGNMTVSLGNLNQNLHNINETMKKFKEFLKQFNDTVLNIDDVIKYIDETIGNLGYTVGFIQISMLDLNGTVNGIADNVVDIDTTLSHIDRSVHDVNYTAAYSNETLDSMLHTLQSLENAIETLVIKVNRVTGGADVFDISLKNINETVKNTHGKLNRLYGKLQNFNSSMNNVANQVNKLNETYSKINKTLENMNEPYMYINGTVLDVIKKLSTMDDRLLDLQKNMAVVNTDLAVMNTSLLESMIWMVEMVQTLTDFNLWVKGNNDSIRVNLRNKAMIETVGMLLNMNGTLSDIGHDVDNINDRLDEAESKLDNIDDRLTRLKNTLYSIDATFKLLDETIQAVNVTVTDTDSSLRVMNSTVKAMDSTFNEISVTFGNINETLRTVNKTIIMINSTSNEINSTVSKVSKTFVSLASTVNTTARSAVKLSSTISNLGGSVAELNAQLYNANESMRITKSKADIANESYRMLNETITGIDETISEMAKNLVDVSRTIVNTNASLAFVNDSILSMQNSFKLISTELFDLQESFMKMNDSMNEFGTAFPNIQISIQETQKVMSALQIEIINVDEDLRGNTHKRDVLVSAHMHLLTDLQSVSDRVDSIYLRAQQLKNKSLYIKNDIDMLDSVVDEVIDTYIKTEKNVKYINETHTNMKDMFDQLQAQTTTTNVSMVAVKQQLDNMMDSFEHLEDVLKNYSNVDVQIDSIRSKFITTFLDYDNIKNNFKNWNVQFEDVNGILWDESENPTGTHDLFQTLVNNTNVVNNTLLSYQTVLNNTNSGIVAIRIFCDDMRNTFIDIGNIRDKINKIEYTESNLNNQIAETAQILKVNDANVTKLLHDLHEQLDSLQNMETTFGTINGTFNSSEQFNSLEITITHSINELQNTIESLQNASNVFQKTVYNYTVANETYQLHAFDQMPDSQQILDDTLLVMNNTKFYIHAVNNDLDTISDEIQNIHNRINDVFKSVENFEDNLIKRKHKNNFVVINRPKIHHGFNTSLERWNQTYDLQSDLLTLLQRLRNKSKQIDKQSMDISNMNISVISEETKIDNLMREATHVAKELSSAKEYLNTFHDNFQQFENLNSTFSDVKKEYAKYNISIDKFGTILENIISATSEMTATATNISISFDDILRQLAEFRELQEPIKNANTYLKLLMSKLNSTSSNLNLAIYELFWLKNEFDTIKNNYTNFTATYIDLAESYVNEAIHELHDHFMNITMDLEQANISTVGLQSIFDDTEHMYNTKVYDRENIDSTIQTIISPNLEVIIEGNYKIDKDLDKINSEIRRLVMHIKGVNETIHITNKQLFIDRQKQLLADTKFPEVEATTDIANQSMTNSSTLLDKAIENLESIMRVYDELTVRLDGYPTVNITLDDYGAKLKKYNDTLHIVSGRMKENIKSLTEVNQTLWIEDEQRYSNNETVSDMKLRYQHVLENLTNILAEIKYIDSIVSTVNNGTHAVNTELAALNNTLSDLDKTNNLLDHLFQDVPLMDDYLNETASKVAGLITNFTNVHRTFNELKYGFIHINLTVYNKHVLPYEVIESKANDSITHLIDIVQSASKDLFTVHNLLDLASKHRREISTSSLSLNDSIDRNTKFILNITNLLRNVKQLLSEVQNKTSGVDILIDDMDIKLRDMERIFNRQEKEEYFVNKFPVIDGSIGKANKSFGDISDSLNEAKQMLEHAMKIYNKLTVRLDEYSTVNILLDDVGRKLNLYNSTLNNASERLKEGYDSWNKINQALWTEDGQRYSDMEPIFNMKMRYHNAEEMLSNLLLDAKYIDSELSTVQNGTNVMHTEMTAINSSLNDLDETNYVLDQLLKDISVISNHFIESKNKIARLSYNLTDADAILGNIKKRFSHINKTIYDKYILQFDLDESKVNKSLIDLKSDINSMSVVLKQARSLLDMADKIRNETSITRTKLDNAISNNNNVVDQLPILLGEVKGTLNAMQDNISVTDQGLVELIKQLSDMKRLFIRHEKEEYFEKYFPIDAYAMLNDSISDTKMGNDYLGEAVSDAVQEYKKLKSNIDIYEHLMFDIFPIGEILAQAAGAVINNSNVLANISVLYRNTAPLLNAKDGHVISDNETIEDMQKRYNEIDRIVNDTNTILAFMKTNLRKEGVLVDDQEKQTKDINELIRLYGQVVNGIHELNSKNERSGEIISDISYTTSQRRSSFNNYTTTYDKLLSKFEGTISDTIESLKESIDNNIDRVNETMWKMEESTNYLLNNVTLAEHLTKQYSDELYESHVDADRLRTYLRKFPDINNTVNNLINIIDEGNAVTNKSRLNNHERLDKLKSDIDRLKNLLADQEKQDFIRENAPRLSDMLAVATQKLNSAATDIYRVNESNNLLEKLYLSVFKSTRNESSVEIPLESVNDAIENAHESIGRLHGIVNTGQSVIDNVNIDMLNITYLYFTANNTINDIKNDFGYLNRTLHDVNANMSSVIKDMFDLNDNITVQKSFLKELKSESKNLMEMKLQVLSSDKVLQYVGKSTAEATGNTALLINQIRQLENTLAEVVKQYQDVKETSLNNDASMLGNTITELKNQLLAVTVLLNKTDANFRKTQIASSDRDYIIKNISRTLDDLKRKVSGVRPIQRQIDSDLVLLNKSITNITVSTNSIANNIPGINKSIEELLEKFRRQQIFEYIKENFPSLLEEYYNVNITLNSLDLRIPDVLSKLQIFKNDTNALVDRLANDTQMKLSLDNIIDAYHQQNETFEKVSSEKIKLGDVFDEFQDVISSNFDTNETLIDIKNRFTKYETILHDMTTKMTALNGTLDDIGLYINRTRHTILKYNEAIDEFMKTQHNAGEISQTLNSLGIVSNDTNSNLQDVESSTNSQTISLTEITIRFIDVTSPSLHRKRKEITNRLLLETKDILDTRRLLDEERRMRDIVKRKMKTVKTLLKQDVTDITKLQMITNDASNSLINISSDTQRGLIKVETHIKPNVLSYKSSIYDIEMDIKMLRRNFSEREKHDFININLPELKSQYEHTNKSLADVRGRLSKTRERNGQLSQTISILQDRISSRDNIQLPIDNAALQYMAFKKNISHESKTYKDSIDHFNQIDTSMFSRAEWSNFTIDELRNNFDSMKHNLSSLNVALANANEHLDKINSSVNENLSDLNHTNYVLDRYDAYIATTDTSEHGLELLSIRLTETENLLDDVKTRFYYDGDRLFNITKQFPGVTNSEIDHVIDDIRSILDGKVGLRIPLANKLFENRIMENYNVVSQRFEDVVYILNETYTTKDELENIFDDVEDTLTNVTVETEYMVNSEEFYREDAIRLSELLNQSNTLLDKLDDLYEIQLKYDVLELYIPILTKHWMHLNTSVRIIEGHLNVSSSNIPEINLFVKDIDTVLRQLKNVNISTEDIHNNIGNATDISIMIGKQVEDIKAKLGEIPLFDIDVDALVNDTSISSSDIQQKIQHLNKSLQVLDKDNEMAKTKLDTMKEIELTANKQSLLLNETLSIFNIVEDQLQMLNNTLIQTMTKHNDTYSKLNEANTTLNSYKDSLRSLKEKYKDYTYNSKEIELVINTTYEDITKLYDNFSNATGVLSDLKQEYRRTNDLLYAVIDDRMLLNETIFQVKSDLLNTTMKVNNVYNVLNNISSSIPTINIALYDIKEMVQDMNMALENENLKSHFAEETLPMLEQKYKIANRTFDMTNKTLIIMAEELDMLNEFVETLKRRMEFLSTINISMSDIDANITHLENRLFIMQDHYNNVKEIVDKFQMDILANNIFGRNISLVDVQDQYRSFNGTLDLINGVLGKIDNEAHEMDDHFEFLNNTMYAIDSALDKFEEKQMNTQIMEKDIENIGKKLSDTNESVSELQTIVQNFSKTIYEMHEFYADVFETTADNNTLINNMLVKTNQSLQNIHTTVNKLQEVYGNNVDALVDMNATLFGSITSYTDLNTTLGDVKEKYLKLNKSLHRLERDIFNAVDVTQETNLTLLALSELIESMNDTLFREKQKYDFIRNNFGNLEDKFKGLTNPLQTTYQTLSNVSDKVTNLTQFVNVVATRLKDFTNIHISLQNNTTKLQKLGNNVLDIRSKLVNVSAMYNQLQDNVTQLDNRSGNMTNIIAKYDLINTTLDNLENNLAEMLFGIENIDLETDIISDRSHELDSALDRLASVNKTTSSLYQSMSEVGKLIAVTITHINESQSTTDDLKTTLLEMKSVYMHLDDSKILANLSSLMKKLNETTLAINEIKNTQQDLIVEATDTFGGLKELKSDINSEISEKRVLDQINKKIELSLPGITNETETLASNQHNIDKETNALQNTISIITSEIWRLNDTLAEEMRKQKFIVDNFPDMEKRYNLLNSYFGSSNRNIANTSQQVNIVAEELSNVKIRLDTISVIAIPLDAELGEVDRMTKTNDNIAEQFENASKEYESLTMHSLINGSTGFQELKDKYAKFDDTMQGVQVQLDKINTGISDLNKAASITNESVHDINFTVDEYIESREKIAHIVETGDILTENIGDTNATIVKMFTDIAKLDESLRDLLMNYSHINDLEIIKAQDLVTKLVKSSKDKISNLQTGISSLGDNNTDIHETIKQMQDAHVTTKEILSELKKHIGLMKNTSSVVNSSLSDLEKERADVNKTAASVRPDIKNLIDEINKLTEKFFKEQEKIDFIKDKKPFLEQRFKDIQLPLTHTNEHISLTDVKLTDLKYVIKTVGARLDKFRTLNITTIPELKHWYNMSQTVSNLSSTFLELGEIYEGLQSLINSIGDRHFTKAQIETKVQEINDTLETIEHKLEKVNKKLLEVNNHVNVTGTILSGLQNSMNKFKALQSGSAKTEHNLKSLNSTVQKLESKIENIAEVVTGVEDQLKAMKIAYAPLNDIQWSKMQPKFNNIISSQFQNINRVNNSLSNQEKKLISTSTKFNKINSEIKNNYLTRNNVDSSIGQLQKNLKLATWQVSDLEKPLNVNNNKLKNIAASTKTFQGQIREMNKTLHKQLLKFNYVLVNLPSLKSEHIKVNTSYVENIPNMDRMQGQITHLVSIIEKVKEKMKLFDLEDSDSSVKKWDTAIQKLNNTIAAILETNKQTGAKLTDLKAILWSTDTLYARQESLADVQARFEGYNKTLADISAASHTIDIKLGALDSAASGVIAQLLERDAILTTTPATTTPSGPPEWLQFHSTNTGVIGKDPGLAECSVGDLSKWHMMKITRINRDGKEEPIAAWKLGAGARKAVRDRRIRVKRTKTATKGKLSVRIQTLQCEDEGSYYCSLDSYNMWPLESTIAVTSPPEDTLKPEFPTEVFEDKVANFSCTGQPGYPNGRLTWKIKRENEADFKQYEFYSSKSKVSDSSCVRTESNSVEHQFDLQWNNTKVRCYIENTNFYAEGVIRLLPYDICNKVRYLGTITHPYTPHKYIVCGKELNIMQCPGNTCYEHKEENCVRCTAGHAGGGDPCIGQPLFSYVAHETDCKKYYICMGPTKTNKKCTKGYFAPNIPGNCVMSYAQSLCGRKAG